MNALVHAPLPSKKPGLLSRWIGHAKLRVKERRERKALHPIQLRPDEIDVLRDFANGGVIGDFSLATHRLERHGGEPRIISASMITAFRELGFVAQNGSGLLVVTPMGRAAAVVAAKNPARLQAGDEGNAAEILRRELLMRVGRHEKWLARAMGGKQMSAKFADLEGIELERRNLSHIQLEGCILCGSNLARADFSGASLQGCDFTRADLRNARFASADLRGCDFSDARLEGAYLSGAVFGRLRAETMEGFRRAHARAVELGNIPADEEPLPDTLPVRFDRARLAGADLRGADLSQASFRGAGLNGADLRDTKLSGCDFAYADLNGVRLSGAAMREANFSLASGVADFDALAAAGANVGHRPDRLMLDRILEANRLWYETCARPDGGTAAGARAVLARMNMADMDLRGASLAGADLREANLAGANLSQSVLISADLRGANLAGANTEGADLRGARMPDGSGHS